MDNSLLADFKKLRLQSKVWKPITLHFIKDFIMSSLIGILLKTSKVGKGLWIKIPIAKFCKISLLCLFNAYNKLGTNK